MSKFKTGSINFEQSNLFYEAGLEIIENTSDEIHNSVMELEAKLTGTWQFENQDEIMQNKFWEILKTWNLFPLYHGDIKSKLSDTFLRENQKWFFEE